MIQQALTVGLFAQESLLVNDNEDTHLFPAKLLTCAVLQVFSGQAQPFCCPVPTILESVADIKFKIREY